MKDCYDEQDYIGHENHTFSMEDTEKIRIPKNIKQVGQSQINNNIFIEDYVITFVHHTGEKIFDRNTIYIMLGKRNLIQEKNYIFINGMLRIEINERVLNGRFPEEIDIEINNKIDMYFQGSSVVGWCIVSDGWNRPQDNIEKTHKMNFGDEDNIFMVYDIYEKEEIIYRYKNGILEKINGFYIYYERNENMQNYMLTVKGNKSIEYGYADDTTKKIRELVNKNGREKYTREKNNDQVVYTNQVIDTKDYSAGAYIKRKNYNLVSKELEKYYKNKKKNKTKDKRNNGKSIQYIVTMASVALILSFGAGKMEKISEATAANAKLAKEKINELTDDKDKNDSKQLEIETISGGVSSGDKGNNKDIGEESSDTSQVTENPEVVNVAQNNDTLQVTENPEVVDVAQNNDISQVTENPEVVDVAQNNDTSQVTENSEVVDVAQNTILSQDTNTQTVESDNQPTTYTVKKGDALVDISRMMYGTIKYVDKIIVANNIEDEDKIYVGQILLIP